ncbi:MAG: hypothetical protein ACU0BZ_07660 [Paracoccus sp. (in: a-proteobacteria)]|jgi:fatty acid desaturase|uniref:hypothetical protein n=1 Tax=unclassified Paracoccus (in: a-proteobacteria) TaxID=2688777 RepID=UPI0025E383E3|nr:MULTISPECIES: hypothetical protein [unclassified Paracoccus (in: a-proteobacteria)]MCS5602293.1 hypothetical protein [Paracoccus sp. (in: a-proteobacteria)]|tara:strand:+ start:1049 stop:1345 length:297 start_codon:yes stop_codon:yes gene_type:complete
MPDRPLFLERASFRRRRLGDAARVLPVLALVAILLPVWWLPAGVSLAFGAVWLFGTWAVLIVLVWALHRGLMRAEAATRQARAQAAPEDEKDGAGDAL